MDIYIVKEKINKLVEKKKIINPFNERLSLQQIVDFEKKHHLVLPHGYRDFLLFIGNGGLGPNYGLLTLQESIIDIKLETKPYINLSLPFQYTTEWNESWIENFDWDDDKPELDIVNKYMDVSHIAGCLQISHYGHGCTNLLTVNAVHSGEIWFDGRADYSGIFPERDKKGKIYSFIEWYNDWLDDELNI